MRYSRGPNIVIGSENEKRTWTLKVRSLSKRDPVPLGKDPNIDADWVVVCTRVREDTPTSYAMTPDEVSKLATRDKRGPNYRLGQRQYDTEAFAERWDRIGSGLALCGAARIGSRPELLRSDPSSSCPYSPKFVYRYSTKFACRILHRSPLRAARMASAACHATREEAKCCGAG
jgi:hypothetical protein